MATKWKRDVIIKERPSKNLKYLAGSGDLIESGDVNHIPEDNEETSQLSSIPEEKSIDQSCVGMQNSRFYFFIERALIQEPSVS